MYTTFRYLVSAFTCMLLSSCADSSNTTSPTEIAGADTAIARRKRQSNKKATR